MCITSAPCIALWYGFGWYPASTCEKKLIATWPWGGGGPGHPPPRARWDLRRRRMDGRRGG